MAQTLKFGNGTWATKEGSTLAYNDENDNYKPLPFTTTRDSIATRVNKDGLIESVVANQARLNYDPTNPQDPHLLLEPERINRVFPNNTLSGYSTLNATVSNNNSTSPDGASNASLITSGSGGTTIGIFKGFSGASASVTHNISVFLKKGTYDRIKVQEGFASANMVVDLSNGTEVSSQNATNKKIEAYPNDWFRISFNFTSASSGNLQFSLFVDGTTSTGITFYAFGGQIEEGSYATSLIPTSGSAVTRTADTCEKSSVASGIIGQTEGVIFLDFENYGQIGTSYGNHFKIESAGNNDRVAIQSDATSLNRLILVINDGSSTFFQPREDISLGRNKIAIKYKSGDIDAYINGVKEQVSTTSFSFANTLNKIYIGQPNKVYQAMVFNEALTDAELQTLTS